MAIQGAGDKPFVPPITPKEAKKIGPVAEETKEAPKKPVQVGGGESKGIGRGPELDTHGIAVRLAAIATEARKKEIEGEDFGKILELIVEQTQIENPQAAMEEINRRVQKEIEETIVSIKANKELMEEAESWQNFAEFLERLGPEQTEHFLELLKNSIKSFK